MKGGMNIFPNHLPGKIENKPVPHIHIIGILMETYTGYTYFGSVEYTTNPIKPHKTPQKEQPCKVLCLHGNRQSKEIFENVLTNTLLRAYKRYHKDTTNPNIMEWQFMEAPFPHSETGRTWYNKELTLSDIGYMSFSEDLTCDTLNMLDTYIKTHEIDILVGFSQGGNVVDTYLRHRPNTIKCAVLFSGYSLITSIPPVYPHTSILNVVSEQDNIVPVTFIPEFPKHQFTNTIYHDKGHKIPTSPIILREIMDFIMHAIG